MIVHTIAGATEYLVLDGSLEDALANLYDLTYLATHLVGGISSSENEPLSAESIHRTLTDAIGSLRPPSGSPSTSGTWRRYRYLTLRYLAGHSHKAVAGELGLSVRQAHRVRLNAIEAVAVVLREELGDGHRESVRPVFYSTPKDFGVLHGNDARATFNDEVARLGGDGRTSLSDVSRELTEVVETVEPLARQRAVNVRLELPDGSCLVSGDPALLRQSILLLITYAMDQQSDGQVRVSVDAQDSAIALDVVYRRKNGVSDPAPRSDDARLATARWLIEAQGGMLDLLVGERHLGLHVLMCPGKTATVLTIDDNPELGRLFEQFLKGTRYHVRRAKSGQTALRLAGQSDVDVVTLDVMMPFQDGWEIFRQLRENQPTSRIPVIICSILPEKDLAIAVGAADFLAKPVTRNALITALDRCCPSGLAVNRALA